MKRSRTTHGLIAALAALYIIVAQGPEVQPERLTRPISASYIAHRHARGYGVIKTWRYYGARAGLRRLAMGLRKGLFRTALGAAIIHSLAVHEAALTQRPVPHIDALPTDRAIVMVVETPLPGSLGKIATHPTLVYRSAHESEWSQMFVNDHPPRVDPVDGSSGRPMYVWWSGPDSPSGSYLADTDIEKGMGSGPPRLAGIWYGAKAEHMIRSFRRDVLRYPDRYQYQPYFGTNSNTFAQRLLEDAGESNVLSGTSIGSDFGTHPRVRFGNQVGFMWWGFGVRAGGGALRISLFDLPFGIDLRHPALLIPDGDGRIGLDPPNASAPAPR